MKHGLITLAAITFLLACNNNSGNTDNMPDSLGNKMTDTGARGDTAYYERMQQKTGPGDTTSSSSTSRRHDTAYYERLPNKPPDSSR